MSNYNRFRIYQDKVLHDSLDRNYYYFNDVHDWSRLCRLLNKMSDKIDYNAELATTEGLLKLEWEKGIYERFSNEVLRLLEKYEIDDLKKLDQVLMNQRVW